MDADAVSEACQINDLDHGKRRVPRTRGVSEACQINDLDHLTVLEEADAIRFRSLSDQ